MPIRGLISWQVTINRRIRRSRAMNTEARTSRRPMKPLPHHRLRKKKMEMQGERPEGSDKAAISSGSTSSMRERKLALIQDVDRLKKKLIHEENIHRALQRAFNRPLGALPRLSPILPRNTQELLAEIAVLEEEVVRLEEQVVNCRHGLYQEVIFICSNRREENAVHLGMLLSSKTSKDERSRFEDDVDLASLLDGYRDKPQSRNVNAGVDLAALLDKSPRSLTQVAQAPSVYASDKMESIIREPMNREKGLKQSCASINDGTEKENTSYSTITKDVQSPRKELFRVKTQARKSSIRMASAQPSLNPPKLISKQEKVIGRDNGPNNISEDVLKCLCSIFMRLSSGNDKLPKMLIFSPSLTLVSQKCELESKFQDPYGTIVEFKDRDIGSYKYIYTIDAGSIDLRRKRNALFLLQKLKLLLGKLASVSLEGLTHQHKLAFWINTYNSCMLNAYLEHGIPESPDMIVELMDEATIAVGGQLLHATTIEHFILRLPFYLKYDCPKAAVKHEELTALSMFGLEWSEPLVTFALSCGSWSSPAVRVYTASHVESELEAAKRDYLQAAVGVSQVNKLMIPKLLDWYMLDFAKDMESLLDWICLQLPDQARKAALGCFEARGDEPVSKVVQVIPYDFSFRYLLTS